MARVLSRPSARGLLLVGGIAAVLAIVRPWTIVPIQSAPSPAAFDAARYAEQAWPRLVDEATRSAIDVGTAVQQASAPGQSSSPGRARFVTATGTVTSIDRHSRVGVARVRLAPPSTDEALIQVGPVIRGTALRDAATFIRFTDFTNQFEFAAVSNALHERVLARVVGRTDLDALTGRTVTVLGATKLPIGGMAGSVDIVPIEIRAAEAAK